MKRSRNEEETWQRPNKIPRSEVEKIISDKVGTAVEQSDLKMKTLMERISVVNSEPKYDARIKKLEAHVKKIKRRGDAVFAYIRKFRSIGISHSPSPPSLSPPPDHPQRCISPAEPIIYMSSRSSVNGGSFIDNASVSSAVNDCVMSTLRRPKEGFWQSLRSKKQVVDLTEEDRAARLKEESQLTQPPDQKLVPSKPEPSKPSSTPPKAIKEENQSVMEENRVISPVLSEKEDWLSKLHPFPHTPFPKELPVVAASHNLPQKLDLKLARIGQELGIAWNVEPKDPHAAEMDCYYIYVSHEHKNCTFSEWKCLGVIKAMPLPMACKVSDCKDKRLCFTVVGKDIYGRYGPYSDIGTVAPGQI